MNSIEDQVESGLSKVVIVGQIRVMTEGYELKRKV